MAKEAAAGKVIHRVLQSWTLQPTEEWLKLYNSKLQELTSIGIKL
jgi:hypothetical protein